MWDDQAPPCSPCEGSPECGDAAQCLRDPEGGGVCAPPCAPGLDCPDGFRCQDVFGLDVCVAVNGCGGGLPPRPPGFSQWLPDRPPFCIDDEDCAEQESCRVYSDREGAPRVCGVRCGRNSECPEGYFCCDPDEGGRLCVPEGHSFANVCD